MQIKNNTLILALNLILLTITYLSKITLKVLKTKNNKV